MRLLLAEDEEAMADAVVAYLEYHHYEVDWAGNGTDALETARMGSYDVLILDIMMPGMDGLTVLRTLRAEGNTTPVLLLTAKGEIRDKVAGFESGSDDYLTKPFALEELRVRIDALTRRGQNYQGEQVTLGNLTLDKNGCALRVDGKNSPLSNREYHLIELFMRNPHVYFSADALLDRDCGRNWSPWGRTLRSCRNAGSDTRWRKNNEEILPQPDYAQRRAFLPDYPGDCGGRNLAVQLSADRRKRGQLYRFGTAEKQGEPGERTAVYAGLTANVRVQAGTAE